MMSAWLALVSGVLVSQVGGVVVDAQTNQPLAGVRVTWSTTTTRTVTAMDGTWSLPSATGTLVVTAGLKGYFTGNATVTAPDTTVELRLDAVPTVDNAGYVPAEASTCAACHPRAEADWRNSGMRHAGTNAWVHDTYNGTGTAGGMGGFVYTRDSVLASQHPQSECASCHQPLQWIKQGFSGAMFPGQSDAVEVQDGVSCEVCHKAANLDESKLNAPGVWPGMFTLSRPANNWQVQYGVLGDVPYVSLTLMRSSLQPQLSAVLCAACHQDKNDPDLDGDFEEDNGVISEPTYGEWLASPYGDPASPLFASCVDCHMPAINLYAACNLMPSNYRRPPGQIRSHKFEGTTPEFLENALSLNLSARLVEGRVVASVALTNDRTGHHVPTGVTIRNMVLLVEAVAYPSGEVLAQLAGPVVDALGGVGDPAQGYYAGLPGKLYGKFIEAADGTGPTFFTDAARIRWDNRLAPLQTDTTSYSFAAPATGGNVTVRARVIYRRSWRALVDAKAWTQDGHGQPLEDVQPPHFGHLMAESRALVPVAAYCDGGLFCQQCETGADCGPGWACFNNRCEDASTQHPDAGMPGSSSSRGSSSSSGVASSGARSSSTAASSVGASSAASTGSPSSSAGGDDGTRGCNCAAGPDRRAPVWALLLGLLVVPAVVGRRRTR